MRAILLFAILCGSALATDWTWNLPKGFPKPQVPADNPMTVEKVELGRYLFYDPRMSVNGKQSCATCHKQELAFTDGQPVGTGATGQKHTRGSMSLVNVAWSAALTWGNPEMTELEKQALVPMMGEHPVELGLREGDKFLPAVRADAAYQVLFAKAFPEDKDPYTIASVTKAIASFERSIISARSPYDRYHYYREDNAVSDSARRGEIVFFSQGPSCSRCHRGFNFSSDSVGEHKRAETPEIDFHNTAVSAGSEKFKAPTLRNIAVTAPYMHDGSIATLEAALDHYAAGGTFHDNPDKDVLLNGFTLNAEQRHDLLEFLKTLTDQEVLHDPRFANPWSAKTVNAKIVH
jgi:cytochrome c peroxidase